MPIAVITGASAGVGRATAREMARRGYDLALIARDRDGLDAATREANASGRKALAIRCDVADAHAVDEAAAQTESQLGEIDVWINDAMTSVFAPVKQTSAAEFERVTRVTYLGVVNGTLAALARMLPRDRGTIVQVGSALAYRAIPLQAAYCAGKHAVKGFTQSLRCELLHDRSNVRVSMVQLPALNTPQFQWVRARLPNRPQPVPPIYEPEIAARAIAYAAERGPREVKVGMTTVLTIWGERLVAGVLDRYLARTGFASQQTDEAMPSRRPDNLYDPVEGDHGAHGDFDARAHGHSPQVVLRTHPRIAAGIVALAGAAAAAIASRD